ncbi:MAG: hypothetical protein WAW53_15160 [Candidatus Dormiibacterota bacterium]
MHASIRRSPLSGWRDEPRANTLGERIHVRDIDPLLRRSLYQLKHLDTAGVFRRPSDDMHMKVVESHLLGDKQYVGLWDMQFGLEGSGDGWNEPPKHRSLIRS